jgi:serine/threonine protein kinase
LYSRDKSFVVTLEDFKLIKVIGEGAFGKVFLVKHEDLDRVYAMKTIRKDKIIDYEHLESTKLEKTILYSVSWDSVNFMYLVEAPIHRADGVRVPE